MIVRHVITLAALVATTAVNAQIAPPPRTGSEVIVATSAQLVPTLRALAAAFATEHQGLPIQIEPLGSDVAMAYLNTGRADLAILGRTAFDQELKAYEWVYRHPPRATPLFQGSLATQGQSPSLAFRVNAANPLKAITLDQVKTAFRVNGPSPTWAELGVAGPVSLKPVQLVIPDTESGTGRFLRSMALADAVQLDWSRVREVGESKPDRTRDNFGTEIAAIVAKDTAALGVGDSSPLAGTRVLAVMVDGQPRMPGDAAYPLKRVVLGYSDPEPRPDAAAFLQFIHSEAAQRLIASSGYRALAR